MKIWSLVWVTFPFGGFRGKDLHDLREILGLQKWIEAINLFALCVNLCDPAGNK